MMNKNMIRNYAISAVASFGLVALMVSADNEVDLPDGRCNAVDGSNSYVMYVHKDSINPSHSSTGLALVPKSSVSFSASIVFEGTTDKGHDLTVIKDADGNGQCRVKQGGDHLNPTYVYQLKSSI